MGETALGTIRLGPSVVVKDRVGRRRYILFQAGEPWPSRSDWSRTIGDRPWKLTVYEAGKGILRVPHTQVDAARAFLTGQGATTLTTSGTIKGCKARWHGTR